MLYLSIFSDLPLYTDEGGTLTLHVWHIGFWLFFFAAVWQCLGHFFLTKWLIQTIEAVISFLFHFVFEKTFTALQLVTQYSFTAGNNILAAVWKYRLGRIALIAAISYALYAYVF